MAQPQNATGGAELARRVGSYLAAVQQWQADTASYEQQAQTQAQAVQQWEQEKDQFNADEARNQAYRQEIVAKVQQARAALDAHRANKPSTSDGPAVDRWNAEDARLTQIYNNAVGLQDGYNETERQLGRRRQALEEQGNAINAKAASLEQKRNALEQRKQQLEQQELALQAERAANAAILSPKIAQSWKFDKHVVRQQEFPPGTTRQQYEDTIKDVLENSTDVARLGDRGSGARRGMYWKDGTIVFDDPGNPVGGTGFRPSTGKTYFDREKARWEI